jgi:hypothetical protein
VQVLLDDDVAAAGEIGVAGRVDDPGLDPGRPRGRLGADDEADQVPLVEVDLM